MNQKVFKEDALYGESTPVSKTRTKAPSARALKTKQKTEKERADKKQTLDREANLKRQKDMTVLIKVLAVFFVFDLMTHEFLFEFTLPHLKYLA
jgi:hypothetical protein